MQPFMDVLRALHAADVRFVVVGGVAVTLHGHVRATVDLDLVVDLVTDNVQRAVSALQTLGLTPRLPVAADDFADPEMRTAWVQQRNLTVFTMHDPSDPRREVDLFADPPIDPATLLEQAMVVQLDDIEVRIASRDHLITMKRLAGRPQDVADIAALEALDER